MLLVDAEVLLELSEFTPSNLFRVDTEGNTRVGNSGTRDHRLIFQFLRPEVKETAILAAGWYHI
jgi:hypothetical protein